jgi:hypothetical protein
MRRAIGVRDRRGDVEAAHERRPKAKVFERRRKSVRNSSPVVATPPASSGRAPKARLEG